MIFSVIYLLFVGLCFVLDIEAIGVVVRSHFSPLRDGQSHYTHNHRRSCFSGFAGFANFFTSMCVCRFHFAFYETVAILFYNGTGSLLVILSSMFKNKKDVESIFFVFDSRVPRL